MAFTRREGRAVPQPPPLVCHMPTRRRGTSNAPRRNVSTLHCPSDAKQTPGSAVEERAMARRRVRVTELRHIIAFRQVPGDVCTRLIQPDYYFLVLQVVPGIYLPYAGRQPLPSHFFVLVHTTIPGSTVLHVRCSPLHVHHYTITLASRASSAQLFEYSEQVPTPVKFTRVTRYSE